MVVNGRKWLGATLSKPMKSTEPLTCTVTQASDLIPCDRSTVYRAIYRGDLRVIKGFGRLRVLKADLDKFLADTVTYTPRKKTLGTPRKGKKAEVSA